MATICESPAFMGISVGSGYSGEGIASLKGKKVGITTAGSLTEWLVQALNLSQGWRGADAAIAVPVGGSPTAAFAALKTGAMMPMSGARRPAISSKRLRRDGCSSIARPM